MADFKSIYKFVFTVTFVLMCLSLSAQNLQQKNDSLVVLIRSYLNTKNTDALYNLTDQELQHYISKKNFSRYLKEKILTLGKVEGFVPIYNKTVNSSYKLKINKDTVLLSLNLDSTFKIRIFIVEKYHPKPLNKFYLVPTSNPLETDLEKKIDAVVRTYIQKSYTIGLSVGIFYASKNSIYNYGETVKGNGAIPNENTIFEIGSISQTFTATLLAYFVNEGKIKLSDPITKYLPDSIAENTWLKTVSILSLSNYTSGLVLFPYYPDLQKSNPTGGYQNLTNDRFFLYLKHSIPRSKPGEVYAYSDIPYNLLAVILERISHKPYEELVKTIICKPLDLESTAQHFSNKSQKNFVKVYNYDGKETLYGNYNALQGAGWLRSTVNDLLKFAEANMQVGQDELSKAFQLTHQVTFITSDQKTKVALGWQILNNSNTPYFLSEKRLSSSSSFLVFNKEKNVAIVILSNSAEPVNHIGVDIIKLLQ